MINELEAMSKEEQLIVDIEMSVHSITSAICSIRKSIEELGEQELTEKTGWLFSEMTRLLEKLEFEIWKYSKKNGKV